MGKDSKQEVITMDTVQQMTSPPATLEGQETDSIHIDTAAIPDHIRDAFIAKTLECFNAFLAVPGNAEWLDARIAAKKAARTAG